MSLTTKKVLRLRRKGEPGRYLDGGPNTDGVKGLYLCVESKTNVSWGLRYQLNGRTHWMGLGSARDISLDKAREKAREAREKLVDRQDPLALRKAERASLAAAQAKTVTFKEAAEALIIGRRAEWKSAKHGQEFIGSLQRYAFPHIGTLNVAEIERPHVLKVLEQQVRATKGSHLAGRFWDARTVTADRLRNRLEMVLDFAVARGYRPAGVNPASWDLLQHAGLARPSKAAKVEHHPAVPYAEVPTVMAELARHQGVAAMALRFTVLTSARSSETLGATWSEIDLDNALWTIPKERMKSGREHRVPLSPQAVELLQSCYRENGNAHVFVGLHRPRLSHAAMLKLLRQIGRKETTHGFRSSFADWAHERTNFPGHAVEISLAHAIGVATEKAYLRSDLFDKRRQLMNRWGDYCTTTPKRAAGNVTPLRAAERVS